MAAPDGVIGALKWALVAMTAGLLLGACQSVSPGSPVDEEELRGRWQVLSLRGDPVEQGSRAYIEFSEPPRLTGNGGCNQFFGVYRYTDHSLAVDSALGSTKMACAAVTMAQEQHLFQLLPEVASAYLDDEVLTLRDGGGEALIRAERQGSVAP